MSKFFSSSVLFHVTGVIAVSQSILVHQYHQGVQNLNKNATILVNSFASGSVFSFLGNPAMLQTLVYLITALYVFYMGRSVLAI